MALGKRITLHRFLNHSFHKVRAVEERPFAVSVSVQTSAHAQLCLLMLGCVFHTSEGGICHSKRCVTTYGQLVQDVAFWFWAFTKHSNYFFSGAFEIIHFYFMYIKQAFQLV